MKTNRVFIIACALAMLAAPADAQQAAQLPRIGILMQTTSPPPPTTRAAQQATPTIPIVASVGDPVETGFTASLARAGGNITGVATVAGELAHKRLELLKEVVPKLRRVAILRDPVTSERQLKAANTPGHSRKREASWPMAPSSPMFSEPPPALLTRS